MRRNIEKKRTRIWKVALPFLVAMLALVGCASVVTVETEGVSTESQVGVETVMVETESVESTEAQTSAEASLEVIQTVTETPTENVDDEEERNSISMLYYLAITAEEILEARNNRLLLEDIYTSLNNEINPSAIDEITQSHLDSLKGVISDFIGITIKRERLNYIYNQEKASTIRDAVPNPLAVLNITNSFNWKKLVTSLSYTIADSYNNYQKSNEAVEQKFLMSGWELDDEELATVEKNRNRAFNYMVDITQEYSLDGKMTLNETAVQDFVKICARENAQEKMRLLKSAEKTYKLLGNYWLELADAYYMEEQYEDCLLCVEKYKELSSEIYRKDYNYVQFLPKAIVAAQMVYSGNEYVTVIAEFADSIIENTADTNAEDWSIKFFATQVYLDLYARTNDAKYLEEAYNIAYNNVAFLLEEQRNLNNIYLADVKLLEEKDIEVPDYRFMNEDEKKVAEKEYKAELKRLKDYNEELIESRKVELPPLYEPLALNCDLLFALAEEMDISTADKANIEKLLKPEKCEIFLSDVVSNYFSFNNDLTSCSIEFNKNEIIIPVELLSSNPSIVVTATDGSVITKFEDCKIAEVERQGDSVDTFYAHISSKQMKDYKWKPNCKVTVEIYNGKISPITFQYKVAEQKENWIFADKVVFEAE